MKETYSQDLAEFSLFQIASTKDVNVMMAEIRATLADANRDWDRRVSSVRLKTFSCFSFVFSTYYASVLVFSAEDAESGVPSRRRSKPGRSRRRVAQLRSGSSHLAQGSSLASLSGGLHHCLVSLKLF